MTTPQDTPHNRNKSNFVMEESGTEMAWLLNADAILTKEMGGLFSERDDIATMRHILDISCGPGGWDLDVARTYPMVEVTGVDISEPMIQYARAHAQARGLDNIHFQVMNALDPFEFPDDSFDLVNARNLEGFMTPATWPVLIQESKRVTRSGGIFRWTEFEAPISSSAALGQLWELMAKATSAAKRSFSPDGRALCIAPYMAPLLREAGYQDVQLKAHPVDFSAGTEIFEGWYQNNMVVFKLLEPFILVTKVTTKEAFEQLYQQMIIDMLSNDFRGMWFFLTAWGRKP